MLLTIFEGSDNTMDLSMFESEGRTHANEEQSGIIRRNRRTVEPSYHTDLFDRARNIYSRGRQRFTFKASRII